MPLYEYKCAYGHVFEVFSSMNSVQSTAPCPAHVAMGERHFSARGIANFTEDRLRLWSNPQQGGRFSNALGCDMPETRKDLERLAAEKGIEFVSPSSMPDEWKEAVEYKAHVDSGGERLEDPSTFYDVSGFNAGDTRPEYMKTKVQP